MGRASIQQARTLGAVLDMRDSGWKIIITANITVDNGIARWHQVHVELRPGDDGYMFKGWFTIYDVKGCDIILGMHWVDNSNWKQSINHRMNEMWIKLGDVPWNDSGKPAWIHYFSSLQPDNKLEEDVLWESTGIMGNEIIYNKQLHCTSHCLLGKAFILHVRYDTEGMHEL